MCLITYSSYLCHFYLHLYLLSQACDGTISLAFQRRYRPISCCNYLSARREETGTKLKSRRDRERERERERERGREIPQNDIARVPRNLRAAGSLARARVSAEPQYALVITPRWITPWNERSVLHAIGASIINLVTCKRLATSSSISFSPLSLFLILADTRTRGDSQTMKIEANGTWDASHF